MSIGDEFLKTLEFVKTNPGVFLMSVRRTLEMASGENIPMNKWMQLLSDAKTEAEKYAIAGGRA